MKVTCKTMYFNGRRYRPGEVFEIPDGSKLSPDMTVVKEAGQKSKAKAADEGPKTLSEINKTDPKLDPKDDLV